jgi:hypothetical protein
VSERCPTCNQKMPEAITVEYVSGEYVDTYWTNEERLDGLTAKQAAWERIRYLKERWGIDARIREVVQGG